MTALSPRRTFSGTALKTIACITMLVDHIGASCIEAGILTPGLDAGTLSQDTLSAYPLYRLDMVLRFTGRLAFPLFCFLLVEGFVHTHNVKGYLGRLVLFGILSEVPFDLAFFRTPFDPSAQNVYWTLALGVLAMAGLKRFEKENGLPGWQGLVWAGGCAALALAAGARRCLPLNVSGAFHPLLMHPAGDALREKFQSIHFAPMQFPVLFNCLGHEMAQNDTVATLLEKQVQSGVRWEATVRRLAELGVDTAIEIGPGRVLTGFVKKTVGNAISCYPVETAAQLQQLLCTMKGA